MNKITKFLDAAVDWYDANVERLTILPLILLHLAFNVAIVITVILVFALFILRVLA